MLRCGVEFIALIGFYTIIDTVSTTNILGQ